MNKRRRFKAKRIRRARRMMQRWPQVTRAQRQAADRFNTLFVPVPMSDIERNTPDPNYGL